MTIQEIQTRKEDQTFDCKSIQIDPKALAIPIVAFANADGGVIAIGVSDNFSRNPQIAAFLKAYNYVKEYGEGVDRMCRELEVNGTIAPVFHTDDFILKVTVTKVTEKLPENKDTLPEKLPENNDTLPKKLPENCPIIDRIIRKANSNGEKLKENKIAILRLIVEDPYISKTDIANTLGISYTAVGSNIKAMRDKYLRRVGPDNGGFWEIIE